LGVGDCGLAPTPNPQSPIPNPQSPFAIKIKTIILNKIWINDIKNKDLE